MSTAAFLWRQGARLLPPLAVWHLRRRARRGKEIAGRLDERRGFGAERPRGRLLWLHAASVGETLSILPLLEALAERDPAMEFLVTTGTVTSAELLQRRIPPGLARRLRHRFVPLDVPRWVHRFLDGWRPDAAVFVESELWPNLLGEARRRGIPLALVNARMSPASARRWARLPGLAGALLGGFRLVLAQTQGDADRFADLLGRAVPCLGNLKDASPPLPADPAALYALKAAVGERPVFLAASTHPGEEAMLLAARPALAEAIPGLLLMVVPRHPERGEAIAALGAAAGLTTARRANGALPGPDTAFYVADTLGELGLFYRLARACLVGGSLVQHGGQNPLEPARLGCPILVGPHAWNFEATIARLDAAGGILRLPEASAPALAEGVKAVLMNCGRGKAMAEAAAAATAQDAGLPGRIAGVLLELLPAAGPGSAG